MMTQDHLAHTLLLQVPFSAWLSLEERARRLATARLGATGVTGDVGRLADPGDIQSYDWLVCHLGLHQQKRGFLTDAGFLYVFSINVAFIRLQDEYFNEQKPISTSVNSMENRHGNIAVNEQLMAPWRDLYLHL